MSENEETRLARADERAERYLRSRGWHKCRCGEWRNGGFYGKYRPGDDDPRRGSYFYAALEAQMGLGPDRALILELLDKGGFIPALPEAVT